MHSKSGQADEDDKPDESPEPTFGFGSIAYASNWGLLSKPVTQLPCLCCVKVLTNIISKLHCRWMDGRQTIEDRVSPSDLFQKRYTMCITIHTYLQRVVLANLQSFIVAFEFRQTLTDVEPSPSYSLIIRGIVLHALFSSSDRSSPLFWLFVEKCV